MAIGPAANIDLEPVVATNPVGAQHELTATVTDASGSRVPNENVTFTVTSDGGPDPASGTATTDENGEATFTYSNTASAFA